MTTLKFTENVEDKNKIQNGEDQSRFYFAGDVKEFADARAQELIDAGVAVKVTAAESKATLNTPDNKAEKNFK